MDLFDAMFTQRAIRRYTSDPVSDEDITKILKAAVRAPSGANRQPWHFVVVRDAEMLRKLGELYWAATEIRARVIEACTRRRRPISAPVTILPSTSGRSRCTLFASWKARTTS